MSDEDVQIVLRALNAFNAGDIERMIAEMAPDIRWEEGAIVFPDLPPVYDGHEGMRRWYREAIVEAWDTFSAELLALRDEGGGRVAQDYRIVARGRGSGIEVDMRIVQTITVRDGQIVLRELERA